MEFEMPKSHVYIKTDKQGRITRCEGEYTLPSDLDGWTLIEEGQPCDRLNLAQSHYFDGGLYTMDGICRYVWDGEQCVLRSEDELDADRKAREPVLTPAQEREKAYNTLAVIQWDGNMITVTEAAQKWSYYAAEGKTDKTDALIILIAEAKQTIRKKYPDVAE